ncbi:MAG TPA: Npt1/Npt2 family nucleotide transporter [Polyangia bacterium]|nr:Npt1/Npt2 family nucleotide transporter [Polyangia bacterium]
MKTRIDRLLRVFSDVHPGEGLRALGMLASLLVLMVAYYLLKTVREPLVLATGGAEWKSYAAGLQAVTLIAFVPAYTWLTRRVGRRGLIIGLVGFFFVNLQLFYVALRLGTRFVGIAFFVWVGIFSLSVIAQFWSFANDLYSRQDGERLFPIIAFGATLGSPIGARIAQALFEHGVSPAAMIQIAAALLIVHGAITLRLVGASTGVASDRPMASGSGGFSLIARSPYLGLVAVLLVLLNVVNTVGEYVLAKNVVHAAAHAADKAAFIGSFYGSFFFWVNVTAALVQAFLVSRLVKRTGVRGVLLLFPLLAFGVYAMMAAGVSFAVLRWLKTADNATDYSVMNTGRAMLWLPTTREEKYRAKQAMDTFVVRFGDVLATAVVVTATSLLHLGPSALAAMNAIVAVGWIFVAAAVARQNSASQARAAEPAAAPVPRLRAA